MAQTDLNIKIGADPRGVVEGVKNAEAALNRLSAAIGKVSHYGIGLGLVVPQVGAMVRSAAQAADAYSNMAARVAIASDGLGNAASAQSALFEVAQRTRQPVEAVAEGYGKLAGIGKELGLSQQEVIRTTETLSKAMALGGGSAEGQKAALLQLGQALGTGALRGDEFNSVMEQAPGLAKLLADALGVPTGALRGMAEQGKLTSDVIISALSTSAGKVNAEFAKLPATIGGALTQVGNSFLQTIGLLDQAGGVSQTAAGALKVLADHMGLALGGAAALTAGITVLRTSTMAATGAMTALRAAMAIAGGPIGLLVTALAAGVTAFAAWKLAGTDAEKAIESQVKESHDEILSRIEKQIKAIEERNKKAAEGLPRLKDQNTEQAGTVYAELETRRQAVINRQGEFADLPEPARLAMVASLTQQVARAYTAYTGAAQIAADKARESGDKLVADAGKTAQLDIDIKREWSAKAIELAKSYNEAIELAQGDPARMAQLTSERDQRLVEGQRATNEKLQALVKAGLAQRMALSDAQAGLALAGAKAAAEAELRLLDERETALKQRRRAGEVDDEAAGQESLRIEQDRLTIKARLVQREIELEEQRQTVPGDAAAATTQAAKLVGLRSQLADATAQLRQAPEKAAIESSALASAATKARLEADLRATEAESQLAADANARDLAELQRRLEAETVSLASFYEQKQAMAQADADRQIALKEQALAAAERTVPQNDAERQQQRGELARLNADIEQLRRTRAQIPADIERERGTAELKAAEDAQRGLLAITQRGIDAQLDITTRAHAAGLADAAELAAATERAALQRVQAEVAAARQILAARQSQGAPAADVRSAQAEVDAALLRQTQQATSPLADAGERIRALREQAGNIRLNLVADPDQRELQAVEARLTKLREESAVIVARLQVQLDATGADDPERSAELLARITALQRATNEAVAAEHDALADRMKPGWQKIIDGWADTTRLMRDASDEMMTSLVKGGEDAFVELGKTGRLSFKSLLDDLQAQSMRLVFRGLVGSLGGGGKEGAAATQGTGLLGLLGQAKSPAGAGPREGDRNFMGPLQDLGDAASTTSATLRSAGDASALLDASATTAGDGLGKLGNGLFSAVQAVFSFVSSLAAGSAGSGAGSLLGLLGLGGKSGGTAAATTSGTPVIEANLAARGATFTGTVAAFASGGAFSSQVVSQPTNFRFSDGGRERLGLMGEAGPEAVMPLAQAPGGGLGVAALDASGRRVGTLRLARDGAGSLAVVAPGPARRGVAGGAGPTRAAAFAAGGVFAGHAARFASGAAFAGQGARLADAAAAAQAPAGRGGTPTVQLTLAPVISIDARSDQAQVRQLVMQGMAQAAQQAQAAVLDTMRRNRQAFA